MGINIKECMDFNKILIDKGYDDLITILVKLRELSVNPIQRQLNINPKISNNVWRFNVDYTWKRQIFNVMQEHGLLNRDVHIVSSNLHSIKKIVIGLILNKHTGYDNLFDFL